MATSTASAACATCAACVPPMRAMFDVPLKTDPKKKVQVEWELAMPNVTFLFNENKNGKVVSFSCPLECNSLYGKLGLKKGNDDAENANNLGETLAQYFTDNLVTLDVSHHALEFRTKDNKALFTVNLKSN